MSDSSIEFLKARVERCVKAIKAFIAIMVAILLSLAVFAAVAGGTGLNLSNPIATLSVIVSLGALAVLAAAGLSVSIIVAFKFASKLKKTGEPEDGVE